MSEHVTLSGMGELSRRIRQDAIVTENSLSVPMYDPMKGLSVPTYDPMKGVVAPAEGGNVVVEVVDGSVEIFGDPAGLRDLARLCLALADPQAPDGAHVHLDPGIIPLELSSASLMLARHVPRFNQ